MSIQPTWGVDPTTALNQAVAQRVHLGYRIESAPMPGQVIMVHGRRPNHILHLLLTVVTGGLWAIVWLLVAASTKETRTVVSVNPDGSINDSLRPLVRPEGMSEAPWYKQPAGIAIMVAVGIAVLIVLGSA